MRALLMLGMMLAFFGTTGVAGTLTAQEKKETKPEARKGEVTGVVTAKGDNWIEVKADGEERRASMCHIGAGATRTREAAWTRP